VNVVTDEGKASGLGAVGGAVAGGVLGHQAGKGRGKDAMTVLGAIGGALAGNAVEKNVRKTQHYEVNVHFEDGSSETFKFEAQPPFGVGDHVKKTGEGLVAN
jgi:outer membrane lipoprotein SlyB